MGYTVHGILQARMLEWVVVPFSRGSFEPRSSMLQVDSLPAEPPGKGILESVAYPFSRWSSWPRNQNGVSCLAGRFFTSCYQGSPEGLVGRGANGSMLQKALPDFNNLNYCQIINILYSFIHINLGKGPFLCDWLWECLELLGGQVHCKPRKREDRQKIQWKSSNSNNHHSALLPQALMVHAPLLPLATHFRFFFSKLGY